MLPGLAVMTTLVPDCTEAACTAAKLENTAVENRITSSVPAPALKSVMMSKPEPTSKTNVSRVQAAGQRIVAAPARQGVVAIAALKKVVTSDTS